MMAVLICGCAGVLLAIIEQVMYDKGMLVTMAGTQISDATILAGFQTGTIILCVLIGLIFAALR